MTEEKFRKAKELQDVINKLDDFIESFSRLEVSLSFYDKVYKDSETKEVDKELKDAIEQYYIDKRDKLQEEFNAL